MDVSDRSLLVRLTQETKLLSHFLWRKQFFAFAGFVSILYFGRRPAARQSWRGIERSVS